MEPFDLQREALVQLKKYGLTDKGWTFYLNPRTTRRLGCCVPAFKTVYIGLGYCYRENAEHVVGTLLHEIAHALVWEACRKAGHGPEWRAMMLMLGQKPERCCKDLAPITKKDIIAAWNHMCKRASHEMIFGRDTYSGVVSTQL